MSSFIRNQGQQLLSNNKQAIAYVVALALLPYTAWLSVAIIALVTLRRGPKEGGWLLVFASFAYYVLALYTTSSVVALVNSLLIFIPCYLAACVLRKTTSWQAVSGVFFLQIGISLLLLHLLLPDFVMAQYEYIKVALNDAQSESTLLSYINDTTTFSHAMLASYLLGLQAVGVVFSACLSLMLARSVQSELFYPGGFKHEMLAFRGDKIGLLLFTIILIAARQHNMLAMSLLPVVGFYFLLAGISLSFNVVAKKRPISSLILIIGTLFLLPFIMLPAYVIFGSLDSLFNLRLYLPSKAGKTI